jgi:hypothetical protein
MADSCLACMLLCCCAVLLSPHLMAGSRCPSWYRASALLAAAKEKVGARLDALP